MTLQHEWCGGCHQWGGDPPIEDGICHVCDRTPDQILEAHGIFKLGVREFLMLEVENREMEQAINLLKLRRKSTL